MEWFESTPCPNLEEERKTIGLFLEKHKACLPQAKENILPEEDMRLEDWMFIFSLEESSYEKMSYGTFYFGLSQLEKTGKYFCVGLSFMTDTIFKKKYEWKVRIAKLISPAKIAQIYFTSFCPSDAVIKLKELDWFKENPLFPERSQKPLLPVLNESIQTGTFPKELSISPIEYSFFNFNLKSRTWDREI